MTENAAGHPSLLAATWAAFRAALDEARRFEGATNPNPPVGAAAFDQAGVLLGVQAHQKAGSKHAEARLIMELDRAGLLESVHTMVVTLEPCNHEGRTPPCTNAIVEAGIPRVIYGVPDPNPQVAGGGAAALKTRGVDVLSLGEISSAEARALEKECRRLIGPFAKWVRTGRPWVTLKRAFTSTGSMIPKAGQKTFTSPASLELAHRLRRRADAILTGSGTVLADLPEFTVRNVPDHPGKRRKVILMDRRHQVPEYWVRQAEARGLEVHRMDTLKQALEFLGKNNVLEVLVEAGPTLSTAILQGDLWDENVVIVQNVGAPDSVEIETKES